MNRIIISAPGRICLFGEHQDYLQLPVITAAINRRVELTAVPITDKVFHIHLPDINKTEILDFSVEKEFSYTRKRDYFKSIYNVLYRKGIRWQQGWDCIVHGNIPINSGTSSSSALNNVWCKFLLEAGENVKPEWKKPEQVGHLSYLAEVMEFNEPGGKMDQLSTAIGGLLHIDFADNENITRLPASLGSFVLGDSLQAKDTMKILKKTKIPALSAAEKIKKVYPQFSFRNFELDNLSDFRLILTEQEMTVMQGMLKNRDICIEAEKIVVKPDIDDTKLGELLTLHHNNLRDNLNISTIKIEKMLIAARAAGALGGKINGSGGGGCMFAYAPNDPQKIVSAIQNAGGKAYIINIDNGLKID